MPTFFSPFTSFQNNGIIKGGGTHLLDHPVVKHAQGLQDNLHSALFHHMSNVDLLFIKFEISLSPTEKCLNGLYAMQGASRGIYGIPVHKVDVSGVGRVLTFYAQYSGTVVSPKNLEDIW